MTLCEAASQNSMRIVRQLIEAGADPNLRKTKELRPIFHWAIVNNMKRLVSILLEYGADVNQRGNIHEGGNPANDCLLLC